jgi:hypothetical protein
VAVAQAYSSVYSVEQEAKAYEQKAIHNEKAKQTLEEAVLDTERRIEVYMHRSQETLQVAKKGIVINVCTRAATPISVVIWPRSTSLQLTECVLHCRLLPSSMDR